MPQRHITSLLAFSFISQHCIGAPSPPRSVLLCQMRWHICVCAVTEGRLPPPAARFWGSVCERLKLFFLLGESLGTRREAGREGDRDRQRGRKEDGRTRWKRKMEGGGMTPKRHPQDCAWGFPSVNARCATYIRCWLMEAKWVLINIALTPSLLSLNCFQADSDGGRLMDGACPHRVPGLTHSPGFWWCSKVTQSDSPDPGNRM